MLFTTLQGVTIKPGRRQGNSTRQIDFAINVLMSGHSIKVIDHATLGDSHCEASEDLMRRIIKRLKSEHPYLIKIDIKKPERIITITDVQVNEEFHI